MVDERSSARVFLMLKLPQGWIPQGTTSAPSFVRNHRLLADHSKTWTFTNAGAILARVIQQFD